MTHRNKLGVSHEFSQKQTTYLRSNNREVRAEVLQGCIRCTEAFDEVKSC